MSLFINKTDVKDVDSAVILGFICCQSVEVYPGRHTARSCGLVPMHGKARFWDVKPDISEKQQHTSVAERNGVVLERLGMPFEPAEGPTTCTQEQFREQLLEQWKSMLQDWKDSGKMSDRVACLGYRRSPATQHLLTRLGIPSFDIAMDSDAIGAEDVEVFLNAPSQEVLPRDELARFEANTIYTPPTKSGWLCIQQVASWYCKWLKTHYPFYSFLTGQDAQSPKTRPVPKSSCGITAELEPQDPNSERGSCQTNERGELPDTTAVLCRWSVATDETRYQKYFPTLPVQWLPIKLPIYWECKYNPVTKKVFYVDHLSKSTHWRLPKEFYDPSSPKDKSVLAHGSQNSPLPSIRYHPYLKIV
eukprot:TRINITY_DN67053_c6_g10_i1.p1 TRINITY_DN67053_c6_g10~~TRINITY_DN67053_c6_g10_i1.p1  ORF type:complete len:361 (+),score=-2.53 TRINITY_DN67053_c6_g10_i1:116-1198(+)